jgi:predicted nucleic acid-binding protein
MSQLFVTNSSPLIVFQRIGQFDLLHATLERLSVPPAVKQEVFGSDPPPEWIDIRTLAQPLASQIVAMRLGPGEREAIALALELRAALLLIDDLPARRLAQSLNIPVMGSLGVLLRAKQEGHILAVRPLMEAMQNEEFRVSDRVFTRILSAAGEN